jgi:hypothetical protein
MEWVEHLPGPAWLYYVAVATFLSVAHLFVQWGQEGAPLISQTIQLTIATAFYYLIATHYLDKLARDAMVRFRPAIKSSAHREINLEYQLTTMPARTVWLMTFLGVLMGVLVLAGVGLHILVYPGTALLATAPAAILESIIVLLLGVCYLICLYHTVHQLRTVSMIYTEIAKIDLFNQGPLHAFARLAAYTAIAWTLPQYFWFSAGLRDAAFGLAMGFFSVTMILAIIAFLWPLQGVHRLLVAKKAQLQGEVGQRLEKSLQLFAQALEKDDMAAMSAISSAISNADHERQIVAAIPTWPWQPGMLRNAATAFFLPLIIWGATRILTWFFGAA